MTDAAAVPPLDRAALLAALDRHGVRFVLVGGDEQVRGEASVETRIRAPASMGR
jgi:hypothetical protein